MPKTRSFSTKSPFGRKSASFGYFVYMTDYQPLTKNIEIIGYITLTSDKIFR